MAGDEAHGKGSPKRSGKAHTFFKPWLRSLPKEKSVDAKEPKIATPSKVSKQKSSLVQSVKPDASTITARTATPSNASPTPSDSEVNHSPNRPLLSGAAPESQFTSPKEHGQITTPLNSFGDRERSESRYKSAAEQLVKSLSLRRANWEAFEIPKFSTISEHDTIPQLREHIQKTLEARKNTVKNKDFWSKGKNIIERTFTAMSPFAKNFLMIAKEGQQVSTYTFISFNIGIDTCTESIWFTLWGATPLNYCISVFESLLTA